MPYWLTRFWKIFFSGCQKVSGTRNLAIFFLWKSCHRTYWLISKANFSFLVRGKKNSIFTYSMNFDFTPCTWVVKYLFQTCLFFLFNFQAKNVFLILNWKTMFQNFTLCTWVFKYLLLFVEWNVEYAPTMSLSCPVPVRGPNLNIEARFRPILS